MLIARSTTAVATRYHLPGGAQIGRLTIAPWIGAPRNGRLKGGEDDVAKIEMGGRTYRIEYETSNPRAFGGHDVRYFLMDGAATLASAAALYEERWHRWRLHVEGVQYELAKQKRWSRALYVLSLDGARVGGVDETTRLFALTRTYEVRTPPSFAPPVQAFVHHLVVVDTYA